MVPLPHSINLLIRLEWACLAVALLLIYGANEGSWTLLLILFLAPDLSMLGYLANARVGAIAYNAAHAVLGPALLALAWMWSSSPILLDLALIWGFHIAFDRALGYGLKLSSFQETHMGRIGRG